MSAVRKDRIDGFPTVLPLIENVCVGRPASLPIQALFYLFLPAERGTWIAGCALPSLT